MKEIIKNSIILCVITLVSGLLLGVVYEVTKEPREKQQEKAKQEAYFTVFENADSFEDYKYDEKAMEKYLKDCGYGNDIAVIDGIVVAKDSSGNDMGYVITITDKEGYGGDIKLSMGITNEGMVNGISFLTLTETAGVGMKAAENSFKKQFAEKPAQIFNYTGETTENENKVDAISGATVTSKAVVNGVNAGVLAYEFISGDSMDNSDSDNSDKNADNADKTESDISEDNLDETESDKEAK